MMPEWVLWESNIYNEIERFGTARFFFRKYHLVADSAYPCKSWIMPPYRVTPGITAQQTKYNTALSKARVVIEHSFGQLKGRWRILQYINVYTVKRAVAILMACCVLHNFCLDQHDDYDQPCENVSNTDESDSVANADVEGIAKREQIVAIINLNN